MKRGKLGEKKRKIKQKRTHGKIKYRMVVQGCRWKRRHKKEGEDTKGNGPGGQSSGLRVRALVNVHVLPVKSNVKSRFHTVQQPVDVKQLQYSVTNCPGGKRIRGAGKRKGKGSLASPPGEENKACVLTHIQHVAYVRAASTLRREA